MRLSILDESSALYMEVWMLGDRIKGCSGVHICCAVLLLTVQCHKTVFVNMKF